MIHSGAFQTHINRPHGLFQKNLIIFYANGFAKQVIQGYQLIAHKSNSTVQSSILAPSNEQNIAYAIKPKSVRAVRRIANQPGIRVIGDHTIQRADSLHRWFGVVVLIE